MCTDAAFHCRGNCSFSKEKWRQVFWFRLKYHVISFTASCFGCSATAGYTNHRSKSVEKWNSDLVWKSGRLVSSVLLLFWLYCWTERYQRLNMLNLNHIPGVISPPVTYTDSNQIFLWFKYSCFKTESCGEKLKLIIHSTLIQQTHFAQPAYLKAFKSLSLLMQTGVPETWLWLGLKRFLE